MSSRQRSPQPLHTCGEAKAASAVGIGSSGLRRALVALVVGSLILLSLPWPLEAQTTANAAVSNVTNDSYTVSWTTDTECQGSVRWGKAGQDLSNTAYDARGQSYQGRTHYAVVPGLEASTEYRFELVSGSTVSTTRYSVTTGLVLEGQGSDQPINLFGHVYGLDGKPVSEAVVLIKINDKDGFDSAGESQWLSAAINRPNGDWGIPIENIRNENRDAFFRFSLSGDEVQVVAYTGASEIRELVDTRVNSAQDSTPIEVQDDATPTDGSTPTPKADTPSPTATTGESGQPPSPTPAETAPPTPSEGRGEYPRPGDQEPPTDTPVPSGQEQPEATPTPYWSEDPSSSPVPPSSEETFTPGAQPTSPNGGATKPPNATASPSGDGGSTGRGSPVAQLRPARITATALAARELSRAQPTVVPSPSIWPALDTSQPGTPTPQASLPPTQSESPAVMTLTLATGALVVVSMVVLGSLWHQARKNRVP